MNRHAASSLPKQPSSATTSPMGSGWPRSARSPRNAMHWPVRWSRFSMERPSRTSLSGTTRLWRTHSGATT